MNINPAFKNAETSLLFKEKLEQAAIFTTAAFIVTIYISTPLSIILSALLGGLWLITGQYKKLFLVLKDSKVNLAALIVFFSLIIGLTYTTAPGTTGFAVLRKYRELLYIPVLSCFFTQPRYRKWAWYAFTAASILTLISSYLMEFKLMGLNRYGTFTLKSRITHSIFIAFFAFFCLHRYFDAKKYRLLYLLIFIVCIHNLYFVTAGRTGQTIFLLLIPLLAVQRFSKKGMMLSLCLLGFLLVSYFHFSDKSSRLHQGLETAETFFNPQHRLKAVESDIRLKFWNNAIELIKERPLLGFGTGSFGQEYRRITGDKSETLENPHNEYLLFTVQGGLIGLMLHLGFLYSQYREARTLPDPDKWLAQGLLLTLITTSQFNSPFLDHAEGHWFAVMIALCYASAHSRHAAAKDQIQLR